MFGLFKTVTESEMYTIRMVASSILEKIDDLPRDFINIMSYEQKQALDKYKEAAIQVLDFGDTEMMRIAYNAGLKNLSAGLAILDATHEHLQSNDQLDKHESDNFNSPTISENIPEVKQPSLREIEDSEDDTEYYLQAQNEIDDGTMSKALWVKALTLCEGDEEKAKYRYISLRVDALIHATNAEAVAKPEAEPIPIAQSEANVLASRAKMLREREREVERKNKAKLEENKARLEAGMLKEKPRT